MSNDLEICAAVAISADAPLSSIPLFLRNPAGREVRVQVVATSVCHTDIMTKQEGLCAFPIVLGHEGVGIVDAIGDEVSEFAIGDHVVLSYDYCGQCQQCAKQKPSYCDEHGKLNFAGVRPDGEKTHRTTDSEVADVFGSFFQQSSFATYALSHESNTIKVEKSLPLHHLAPLGCGVQTGAGTVMNTLQVQDGANLVVFGCGCVGLSAIMAAKLAGANNIVAVDINPKRLDLAHELGAQVTVLAGGFDDAAGLVKHVQKITGGCHYAIDTTGVPTVLRQALECCGPLGVTAMIAPGVPGSKVSIEMLGLLPGKSMRGVIQGDAVSKIFIPRLIELWQSGQFPFERLITEYQGIDAINDAIQDMIRGDVVKPVVVIDSEYQP